MTNNCIRENSLAVCIGGYERMIGRTVEVIQIKNDHNMLAIHDPIEHVFLYARTEFFIPIEQWKLNNP